MRQPWLLKQSDLRAETSFSAESIVHDFHRKKIWVKRANFIFYSSKQFRDILDIYFGGLLLENLGCLCKIKISSTLIWHIELKLFLNGWFNCKCVEKRVLNEMECYDTYGWVAGCKFLVGFCSFNPGLNACLPSRLQRKAIEAFSRRRRLYNYKKNLQPSKQTKMFISSFSAYYVLVLNI